MKSLPVSAKLASALSLTILLTGILAADYAYTVTQTHHLSTSPRNTGLWGTSSLASILEMHGYNVVLGGVEDVKALAGMGHRVAYLLIGPDKALTSYERAVIRSLLGHGLVGLIIADEIGIVNLFLEEMGLPSIRPEIVVFRGYQLAPMECLGRVFMGSKVATLNAVEEAEVVCRLLEPLEGVVAILAEKNGAKILVVADSSIFANFMVEGVPPFKPTADVAISLVDLVAKNATVVVIDDEHYHEVEHSLLGHLLALPLRLTVALAAFIKAVISANNPLIVAIAVSLMGLFVGLLASAVARSRLGLEA